MSRCTQPSPASTVEEDGLAELPAAVERVTHAGGEFTSIGLGASIVASTSGFFYDISMPPASVLAEVDSADDAGQLVPADSEHLGDGVKSPFPFCAAAAAEGLPPSAPDGPWGRSWEWSEGRPGGGRSTAAAAADGLPPSAPDGPRGRSWEPSEGGAGGGGSAAADSSRCLSPVSWIQTHGVASTSFNRSLIRKSPPARQEERAKRRALALFPTILTVADPLASMNFCNWHAVSFKEDGFYMGEELLERKGRNLASIIGNKGDSWGCFKLLEPLPDPEVATFQKGRKG